MPIRPHHRRSEIDPKWLTDAAEVYNPDERAAMLWPYHADSGWRAFTNNYGIVDALKSKNLVKSAA
ncbi:hypothetical protein [Escherichia coli]|uniref:hypothetical protein n=1 Tax=Escherichia coli TaxID=562 RepID=UPI002FCCD4C8